MNRFTTSWLFLTLIVTCGIAAGSMSIVGCVPDEEPNLRTSRRAPSKQTVDDEDDRDDDGDSKSSSGDNPAPAKLDASAPEAAPPPVLITAFGNAGPFAPSPPQISSARHDGWRSNAGQDCMTCHDGKTSGVPRFVIAGTVYTGATSGTGARNVQVRMVDATGQEIASIGTDDSGNFWLKAGALTELPAGAAVGVRNALSTKLMARKIDSTAAGSCNRFGCHNTERRIFVQ
jgi:hypothetical protein